MPTTRTDYADLPELALTIARSRIVVPAQAAESPVLPAGFDGIDIAVLEWIAAQGRRAGRALVRM